MKQQPGGGAAERSKPAFEAEGSRVQHFQFGPWIFDVNKAHAMIAETPRETRQLPVQPWARFYGLDSTEEQRFSLFWPSANLDKDYAMTTDLSEPVLIATLRNNDGEDFPLLIDGTHRLYRAYAEGIAELPAYVLSADETLAVREDAFIGSSICWPSHDDTWRVGGGAEDGR